VHAACIDTWLARSVLCPMCKLDARTVVPPTRSSQHSRSPQHTHVAVSSAAVAPQPRNAFGSPSAQPVGRRSSISGDETDGEDGDGYMREAVGGGHAMDGSFEIRESASVPVGRSRARQDPGTPPASSSSPPSQDLPRIVMASQSRNGARVSTLRLAALAARNDAPEP